MAWQGRYTESITKKMDDLAGSRYQPNYDTQIKSTAQQITDYKPYTSQYQPQIDQTTDKLLNYGDYSGKWEPKLEQTAQQIGNYGNYASRYQGQIDSLMNQLGNWQYDPESDQSYQAYKRQYTDLGNKAMRNTLGQVSARTGGLASSYAGSAAQQSYNDYMQQLSNIIPQLEAQAYNRASNSLNMYNQADTRDYGRWNDTRADLYNQAQLYSNLDNTDYSRWADAYNRLYNTGNYLRGLDSDQYGRWQDALNNLYQQNSMYLGMDQNEFNRYAQQHQDEYSQVKAMQDYNDWEYQQYLQDLAEQQAALAAMGGGYGGGGYGGGSGGSSSSKSSGLTEQDLVRAAAAARAGGATYSETMNAIKQDAAANGLTGNIATRIMADMAGNKATLNPTNALAIQSGLGAYANQPTSTKKVSNKKK